MKEGSFQKKPEVKDVYKNTFKATFGKNDEKQRLKTLVKIINESFVEERYDTVIQHCDIILEFTSTDLYVVTKKKFAQHKKQEALQKLASQLIASENQVAESDVVEPALPKSKPKLLPGHSSSSVLVKKPKSHSLRAGLPKKNKNKEESEAVIKEFLETGGLKSRPEYLDAMANIDATLRGYKSNNEDFNLELFGQILCENVNIAHDHAALQNLFWIGYIFYIPESRQTLSDGSDSTVASYRYFNAIMQKATGSYYIILASYMRDIISEEKFNSDADDLYDYALDCDLKEALVRKGYRCYKLGRYSDALRYLDQCLARYPQYKPALYIKENVVEKLKQESQPNTPKAPEINVKANANLSSDKLSPELQEAIKKLEKNELVELKLNGEYKKFGDKAAQTLAAVLPKCKVLINLELMENDVGDIGVQALAAVLPQCLRLINLDLRSNSFGDTGMQALIAVIPKCPTLRYLNFGDNNKISNALEKEIDDLLSKNRCRGDGLVDAAGQGDLPKLKYYLSLGVSVWSRKWDYYRDYCDYGCHVDPHYDTPLELATRNGHLEVVQCLIEHGASQQQESFQDRVAQNPIQLPQAEEKRTGFGLLQKRRTASKSSETSNPSNTRESSGSISSINEEKKVEEHYERGEYKAAIKACSEIIKKDPTNDFAWMYRGASKRMVDLRSEAISDLSKAIELNPHNCFSWERRAATFLELGVYENAIEDCNQTLRLNPKSDFAWSCLGKAKKKLGRYLEAQADLRKALKLNPISDFIKKAIEEIEESIQSLKFTDPESSSTLVDIKNKKECETALCACSKAIKYNANDHSAWINRALLQRELNHFEEAIQDFSEAIKLDLNSDFAFAHRGALKIILKRYENALQDLTEATRLNPNSGFAWAARGIANYNAGHYAEATEDLNKALGLRLKNLHSSDVPKISALLETLSLPSASAPTLTTILSGSAAPLADPSAASAPHMGEQTQFDLKVAAKPPHINFKQFKLDKKPLGFGGMGAVYRGTFKNAKKQTQVVAVKMLLDLEQNKDISIDAIKREYDILGTLCHPNIVNIVGYSNNSRGFCLVMDFYPNGPLSEYLYAPIIWNNPLAWRLCCAKEIAEGLDFLHKRNLLHLDLKPENVFLREDWHIVIGDFGISRSVQTHHGHQTTNSRAVGTVAFVAPEIMVSSDADGKTRYSRPNDIYSLAMILWCCAAQKKPYAEMDPFRVIAFVGMQKQREKIPEQTPIKLAALINTCWLHDPSARPTAEHVSRELYQIHDEELHSNNNRNLFPTKK